MSNLVDRLRENATWLGFDSANLMVEAADEIERLEARIDQLTDEIWGHIDAAEAANDW